MNEIGEFLRQKREAKKMTIRQLAMYAGVSDSYLSLLERGIRGKRGPTPAFLRKLVSPLGVPYEVLMEKAGYQIQTRDDIVLNGFVLQMLRDTLGDTAEQFGKRVGMSLSEIECLEQTGVGLDTLQIFFEKLFGYQRMLTPEQKVILTSYGEKFPQLPPDALERIEGILVGLYRLM